MLLVSIIKLEKKYPESMILPPRHKLFLDFFIL